ncbi:FRIGIDA-like protein 5 [Momordica charantia]|uniref:FRIGIDA-like protein 5 n=1 Tax=Momordica charantia TaxID=3673 RepID=A0A6J1D8P6_MOMCH|nr:FRIGIDA-like protein 5 [Momordica charantia]XP_022149542.1 FRIGIDA-like protein 5 [Momordica charantia]
MEKITSHMKLAESKQSNLCKAHEQLHSEASSFLLFSLQWKDLEKHFDSTREMIQTQYEALEGREKEIALKEKELVDVGKSLDECSEALELKRDELSKLNSLIEESYGDLRLKEKELDLAQERLGVLLKDVKLKEDEANMVRMRILDVEKEFEHKEKAFDMVRKKIDDCEQVIESKEQELNGIMQLIKERSMEYELQRKSVESIRTLLQEHEEELVTKEKQYDAIQMAIKESNVELKLKEKELESIQNMVATKWKEKRLDKIEKNIRLRTEELDLKEKEFVLMQNKLKDLSEDLLLKESELNSIKMCIKEHSKELDMQEKQLDSTQQSIRDCQNEVLLLTRYVSSLEKAIIECSKEWELKENHVDALQVSVDDYSNELPSMEEQQNSISLIVDKCLEGLRAQKEHFNLLRKSIEERSKKLKNEENDFERRTEELNRKDEKVRMYLKEIELVKVDMDSQMKLLEKGREELRLKEIQHKVQAEKLELKEKDISVVRDFMEKCSDNAKLTDSPNTLHPKVKTEEDRRHANSSNTLNFHAGVTVDGKLLLVLLCEHLKLHDLVRAELVVTLQTSSDPAKLVLDAMRWFYPSPQMVSEDAKIDLHNIKRGCVLLCEVLLKFSPQITPPLKEEALKLAGQWKARMGAVVENHVEVVAFLLLVANFGLASDFNADELQTLLNSVSQYKQALELGRALGIADESSVGRATCLVKLEQRESSPANSAPVSSLKNEQLSMDPNERRLHLLLNEQLTELKLMPSAILSILKESSDPPKLVLDVIQVSFYQQLNKGQIGLDENFLRWCILLLKQLMQISPKVDAKLREDAMKLAVVWKLNIGSDKNNSLETVCFLQLLVSFGLTTSFSEDEILKLFESIVLHEQASDLCAKFGFTQKIYDLVQNLIGTKQFVKAVRFICGYKLECFRPVQILSEYLRDARNATLKVSKKKNTGQEDIRAMDEAIDKEIDAAKSVISCVADCNLSSEISSQGLEKLIVSLEEMRRLKCNSQVQPPRPTTVEMKQPPPINAQSQWSHKADIEVEFPHPINFQSQQPHRADWEAQRPHPTKGEMQQPHLTKAEAQQQPPYPTHHARQQRPTRQPQQQYPPSITVPQELRKTKRKDYQFQNGLNKYRRKSPPTRPVFLSSSPSGHDEKPNFQRYNSRFSGMNGLFGLHEGGHGSTEHGNHYTRAPWPRPP